MTIALAIIVILTALCTLTTAIVTLVKTAQQGAAIAQIHILVNSRLTAVIDWGNKLAQILDAHGIEAPAPPGGLESHGNTAARPNEPR